MKKLNKKTNEEIVEKAIEEIEEEVKAEDKVATVNQTILKKFLKLVVPKFNLENFQLTGFKNKGGKGTISFENVDFAIDITLHNIEQLYLEVEGEEEDE